VKRWHTREDSGIELDETLRWWHDGEPIEHPKIIETFNRGLKVAEDGRFKLEVGNDWCFVKVHGPAFGVVAVDVSDDGLSVRLTDRTAELMDPSTLALSADGVLTVKVKDGRATARFSRDAQFQLGELVEATERGPVLRAGGREWALPVSV
jgi:uncharacterized protein